MSKAFVLSRPASEEIVYIAEDNLIAAIAFKLIIKKAISQESRKELELYKKYTNDPEFKKAFESSIFKLMSQGNDVLYQLH